MSCIPPAPMVFNPSQQATRAFRTLFNEWQYTPLGESVHATWKRGSDEYHITTEIPGFPRSARVHNYFNLP